MISKDLTGSQSLAVVTTSAETCLILSPYIERHLRYDRLSGRRPVYGRILESHFNSGARDAFVCCKRTNQWKSASDSI